jgi:hypothetical protein
MRSKRENESWVIKAGHEIILKKAEGDKLSPREQLVYCLWCADYGIRNAGDISPAYKIYPEFHSDAERIAIELNLPITQDFFALSPEGLESSYFEKFDAVCEEIREVR